MSSISKSTKSRRKKERGSDRKVALDFIDVQFLHEMAGGEVQFNLAELTLPGGSGSFTNPSPAVVSAATRNMRSKLRLFNGSGKRLALGQEYEVVGNLVTFKNIVAGVGEIFFGDIKNIPRTGADFLDGLVQTSDGFLVPGDTQFNLGFEYRVGDGLGASNRRGPLRVERNRLTQYVNTDFETSGPSEDGDYAHVRAGSTAFGTIIEFNNPGALLPGGLPEFISVESRAIFVDKNNESLRSEVQVQQGALIRMAEELGIIQSLDPNIFFQGSPTAVQLKQFGDRMFQLEKILGVQIPIFDIDWIDYTPVWSGTNPASISGKFKQRGPEIDCQIEVLWDGSTAHASAIQTFGVPSQFNIDGDQILRNIDLKGNLGLAQFFESGINNPAGRVGYQGGPGPGSTVIAIALEVIGVDVATDFSVTDVKPFTWGTSDRLNLSFTVPITQTGFKSIKDILGL